jgi:DNA-binding beta-propeller fold protein YncE
MLLRQIDSRGLRGLLLLAACLVLFPGGADAGHKSDVNRDGVVDLQDLILYSEKELGQDWREVDWCAWLEVPHKHDDHIQELKDFVRELFECDSGSGPGPLAVQNSNDHPTRVAWGPGGKIYATDARVGSVFIYERLPALTAVGELKGLDKPLGIAVDSLGKMYVGNDGRDNVEVYAPDGSLSMSLGDGVIQMPNDLALDAAGLLYVADSRGGLVWVFDSATGSFVRTIGGGVLRFPIAVAVSGTELFVANHASFSIQVFDLLGNPIRSFGERVRQGSLGFKWKGKFIRLQGLALDGVPRLHVLDAHMGVVQLLNPANGAYLGMYGSKGPDPGQLNLPLGIGVNGSGETAVANSENHRVEILTAP